MDESRKHSVELTDHQLFLISTALEMMADDRSDSQRMIIDPAERRDLEDEECECRELQERLEALREPLAEEEVDG
jgi:hypothetical protein